MTSSGWWRIVWRSSDQLWPRQEILEWFKRSTNRWRCCRTSKRGCSTSNRSIRELFNGLEGDFFATIVLFREMANPTRKISIFWVGLAVCRYIVISESKVPLANNFKIKCLGCFPKPIPSVTTSVCATKSSLKFVKNMSGLSLLKSFSFACRHPPPPPSSVRSKSRWIWNDGRRPIKKSCLYELGVGWPDTLLVYWSAIGNQWGSEAKY